MDSTKSTTVPATTKRLRKGSVVTFVIAVLLAGFYLVNFGLMANFHEVVADSVYRSAQPSPGQLERWIRRYDIKTVINLRGNAGKITESEKAVTGRLGVEMVSMAFSAGKIPSKGQLTELIRTIENCRLPVLIHCRQGIDRAGTAGTIAAMAIGKTDYDTAKWQAYVPPGPWKRKRKRNYNHISDVLKLYETYCRRSGLGNGEWGQFKKWAIDIRESVDVE